MFSERNCMKWLRCAREKLSSWILQCFTAQDTGFLDAAEFLYLAADGLVGFKEAIATGESSGASTRMISPSHLNGGFHKWGYPKMDVFFMEDPI